MAREKSFEEFKKKCDWHKTHQERQSSSSLVFCDECLARRMKHAVCCEEYCELYDDGGWGL